MTFLTVAFCATPALGLAVMAVDTTLGQRTATFYGLTYSEALTEARNAMPGAKVDGQLKKTVREEKARGWA